MIKPILYIAIQFLSNTFFRQDDWSN